MSPQKILDFWFTQLTPAAWWKKDAELDSFIAQEFSDVHQQAAAVELYHWRETAEGRLAEIIVLDQFSRNIFRDKQDSFQHDPLALSLSQAAVDVGADKALPATHSSFLYMPYMHSESLLIHERALQLFSQPGLETNLDFEIQHKTIIEKFGRYPHRNAILGRESTTKEIEFLKTNQGF